MSDADEDWLWLRGKAEHRLPARKAERELWGSITAHSLEARHGRTKHDLLVLAGNDYVRPLLRTVAFWWPDTSWRKHVHLPLAGKMIGRRLSWLNEQLTGSAP